MHQFQYIKNWKELIRDENHELILRLLEIGIKVADAENAIKKTITLKDNKLIIQGKCFNLNNFEKIVVIGAGKASGRMAKALEELLYDKIYKGIVLVPEEITRKYRLEKIKLLPSDHPIPSERGVNSAKELVKLVEETKSKKTLFIVLLSGGGSALMPLPANSISIEDVKELTSLLLKCGATIDEINCVRKHISRIKGGQLARLCYPSTVVSLIISDVVGDKVDVIASGPTAPDPTTFEDAVNILKKYSIYRSVPQSIINYLEKGKKGIVPETPKPGDIIFSRVFNFIIASNRESLLNMAKVASSMGYNTLILSSQIEGEARHVGIVIASICKEILQSNHPIPKPALIFAGGETTVTVKGRGKGGRNQELALSAAIKIADCKGIYIASMGSDGIDGITDAAGAIVDSSTCSRALSMGLNPIKYLENNDSYTFFKKVGGLIITGYTETNVNDFIIGLIT